MLKTDPMLTRLHLRFYLHTFCLALACLLLRAPLAAQAPATESEPLLRVEVKLVSVFVNVTTPSGAFVGGLDRENFRLAEDGRPQAISIFERQSQLPLNIVLAIDTSGSVRKDLPEETLAARRFAHTLLRRQDQMSVFEFATRVRQLSGFTSKLPQIDHALDQLRPGHATALYETIQKASLQLGSLDGRRILVLVSDGGDTASEIDYSQALEAALRNQVMIYPLIDVPIEVSAGRNLGGEHALIALAEQTGGRYFYVDSGGLDQAYQKLGEDLRTQYLLGYYPKDQEPGRSFHRIQVTIPRAAPGQFLLHHKTGYFTAPQHTPAP